MTKSTTLGLGLLATIIVGAALVAATQKTVQMPIRPQGPLVDRASVISVADMPMPSSLPILAQSMPEFVGITRWWNTPDGKPLTPEKLKGKVVLIDFWTYSCINCIRTYPFIKSMHEKYADKGLVIVGVHTPEFAFEAKPENVEAEITKNGFGHPIALDPDYLTWNAYNNHYWPAEYFFDRQGRLRRTHFGEGEYDESEEAIRALLAEAPGVDLGPAGVSSTLPDFSKIKTRETYFGLDRGEEFMGHPGSPGLDVTYVAAQNVTPNRWTAGGTWRFAPEYAEARSAGAVFRFSVQAKKMHLVLEAADASDKTIEVFVDGKKTTNIIVNRSTLYDIAEFTDAERHTIEIRMKDAGVRFYAATFS